MFSNVGDSAKKYLDLLFSKLSIAQSSGKLRERHRFHITTLVLCKNFNARAGHNLQKRIGFYIGTFIIIDLKIIRWLVIEGISFISIFIICKFSIIFWMPCAIHLPAVYPIRTLPYSLPTGWGMFGDFISSIKEQ
jgi:hypothetical protein